MSTSKEKGIDKQFARKKKHKFYQHKRQLEILQSKMNIGKLRERKQNISFLSAKEG